MDTKQLVACGFSARTFAYQALTQIFEAKRDYSQSSFAPLNVHAFDWGREVSVGFSYWEFLETKSFEKSGFF